MKIKEAVRTAARKKYDGREDLSRAGRLSLLVILTLGALVGAWGFVCLIMALIQTGLGGMLGSFWAAITGK